MAMQQISPHYFTLVGADDFRCRSRRLRYDKAQQAMVLERNDQLRLPDTDKAKAEALLKDHQSVLCDANRQLAWIAKDGKSLLTGGGIDDASAEPVRANSVEASEESQELLELQPVTAPGDAVFTALAMWQRSIALGWSDVDNAKHGVDIVELGSKVRYRLDTLEDAPDQVWIDQQDRVWIISQDNRLSLATGRPLPQAWRPEGTKFRPLHNNLHPFEIQASYALTAGSKVLALCGDKKQLYLLREGDIQRYQLDAPQRGPVIFTLDEALPYVTDCRVLPGGRMALWAPAGLNQRRAAQDCPIVELDEEAKQAYLVRERYPRRSLAVNAFLPNPDAAAFYLSNNKVLELTGLPQVRYLKRGASILRKKLDSRVTDTLWDRISLDAVIPGGARIKILLRAYNHSNERRKTDWHEQGCAAPSSIASRSGIEGASVWDLVIRKEKNTGSVREIRGRYLEIKLMFESNGLCTPQLFSMQVWQPRLSWQQQFLPEFMHQVEEPVEDAIGLANGADVRERMLTAFAALAYSVDKKIDTAETLIDPLTAPAALLPRLALMLGEHPPAHWPVQRRRNWLAQSGLLQRMRGTYRGLLLALDIATDGGVSRGQIVPVEDFRLRRPLFCALGVDFASGWHPLTLNTVQSGNSIVGDTLTLGPDDARTLLLELMPDAVQSATVFELLEAYADSHAHHISIILHASAADFRGVITELLEAELPAHLDYKIIQTEHSFVPGLAPLLGIHTFLEEFPAWRRMVLNQDRIGSAAVLMNTAGLQPGRAAVPITNGENA